MFRLSAIIYFLIIFTLLISFSDEISADSRQGLIDRIKSFRGKPAEFTIISPGTLKMEGGIQKETYQLYLENINDEINTLIINSTGGCTNAGVKIGLDILQRGLTVIVDGMAGSSAANYIFLAGNRRIIKRGFVAFHGNSTALLKEEGWHQIREQMWKQTKSHGIMKEDFEEIFKKHRKEIKETIDLEKLFYEKINVSQEFFDLTQSKGKGLIDYSDYTFDFLIPSPVTLEKWGIKNVEGISDINMAIELGIKVIYY